MVSRHLVRQRGIIKLSSGQVLAAARVTIPADGSVEQGTANLDEIARWLIAQVSRSAPT
jgi:hypothetical protein